MNGPTILKQKMSESENKDQMTVKYDSEFEANDNERKWKEDPKEHSHHNDLGKCSNTTISAVWLKADDMNVSESDETETEICVKWILTGVAQPQSHLGHWVILFSNKLFIDFLKFKSFPDGHLEPIVNIENHFYSPFDCSAFSHPLTLTHIHIHSHSLTFTLTSNILPIGHRPAHKLTG